MEPSISSLTFKGSILEAIVEAKRQRKLFVVYLSGEDAESVRLENSTWTEPHVAESLLKYCILLHISEGSTDAAHLSAIYPQRGIPCITVIAYTGVQLWQNEGFVGAEILASTFEKTWLSVHIQDTTATFLTAALATKDSVSSTSEADNNASIEQWNSSSTNFPSPSTDRLVQPSEARPLVTPEIIEETKTYQCTVEKNTELGEEEYSKSIYSKEQDNGVAGCSIPSTSSAEMATESFIPVAVAPDGAGVGHMSFIVEDRSPPIDESTNGSDLHSVMSEEASKLVVDKPTEIVEDDKTGAREDKKSGMSDISSGVRNMNDVYLNIRMPSGASLQEKFCVTSTLEMVKDFVDKNQAFGIGSYNLAIPYPRNVFSDQDLSKSLADLGLFNRQALIVIPHHESTSHSKGRSASHDLKNSAAGDESLNEDNDGYFGYVKKILSFMNPFSYFGGNASTSSSSLEPRSSMWQYDPNPALRNNLAGAERSYIPYSANRTERPYMPYSPNRNNSGNSKTDGKGRQTVSSHFGSNIHTLRHNEDDDRSTDRNAFWNGNSTQYGGDSDGK